MNRILEIPEHPKWCSEPIRRTSGRTSGGPRGSPDYLCIIRAHFLHMYVYNIYIYIYIHTYRDIKLIVYIYIYIYW